MPTDRDALEMIISARTVYNAVNILLLNSENSMQYVSNPLTDNDK